MRQTRVRPMVEGGLLAAIAIIFAMVSIYLPIIGSLVSLFLPVPIILLGVRHGYKWSILATLVAGIFSAMLIGPLKASVVIGFGLIGIVLGYAFRMNFSPMKTILWSFIAVLISNIALLWLGDLTTGVNFLEEYRVFIAKIIEEIITIDQTKGISEETLAQLVAIKPIMIKIYQMAIPSMILMVCAGETFGIFFIAKVVLKRFGYTIEDFPPFRNWMLPDCIAYFFILSLVMIYWGYSRELAIIYNSGINIGLLSGIALLVQGISLFYYVGDKYNLSRVVKGIILLLILSNLFLISVLIYFAIADIIIDYRRLRAPRNME